MSLTAYQMQLTRLVFLAQQERRAADMARRILVALQPKDLKDKLDGILKATVDRIERQIDAALTERWTGGEFTMNSSCVDKSDEILEELRKRFHGWTVKRLRSEGSGDYAGYSYYIVMKPKPVE